MIPVSQESEQNGITNFMLYSKWQDYDMVLFRNILSVFHHGH